MALAVVSRVLPEVAPCPWSLQDFASLLQDYKATQKLASQREAASLPRAPPPPRAPTESTPLLGGFPTDDATPADDIESGLQRQAQAQLQAQVEAQRLDVAIAYNEQLIEERDQGIADIQRQIGEVRGPWYCYDSLAAAADCMHSWRRRVRWLADAAARITAVAARYFKGSAR